jgi:tetratricopeptide (TPR) repeat protein
MLIKLLKVISTEKINFKRLKILYSMKQFLTQYKNNELSSTDTEGVEKMMIEAIVKREQQQKWATLLAAEGIQRASAETTQQRTGTRTVNMWRYAVGLAASFLLVAVIWQTMGTTSKTALQLADNYMMTDRFESPSVRMGATEDTKNWDEAKNAYREAQFEKVILAIGAIPNPTTEQLFYLGLSYLYQKEPDLEKAVFYFTTNLERRDGNFKDESRWYLALTLIKMDRKEEAKNILQQLLRLGENGWKAKEAKKLLEKL